MLTHDISRAELFALFLLIEIPDVIKEKFAEVGIMNLVMPLQQEPEKRYLLNEAAFSCVPDRDYMDMHSNLRRFCKWYWIRFNKMKRQGYDPNQEIMQIGYCSQSSQPCYLGRGHYVDLEEAAKYFAKQFICTWEKFITVQA